MIGWFLGGLGACIGVREEIRGDGRVKKGRQREGYGWHCFVGLSTSGG